MVSSFHGSPASDARRAQRAGGPHAGLTLESKDNNVRAPLPFVVRAHRCHKRLCRRCGGQLGYRVRQRLLDKVGLFRWGRLLTLTVDQVGTVTGRGFESPEAAYEYVTNKRLVARLMRELGITRWVWVLEFQRNAWPHWHVLADVGSGFIDYNRLHALWRDRWGVGLAKDSGVKFSDGEHAIFYITKYLTKQPEQGYPRWLWARVHQGQRNAVRFVGASRAVGRLVMPEELADGVTDIEPAEGDEHVKGAADELPATTYYEDVRWCGSRSKVFERVVDAEGEERLRYVGTLPVSPGHLVIDPDVRRCCREVGVDFELQEECGEAKPGDEGPRLWWHVAGDIPSVRTVGLLARRLADVRAGGIWNQGQEVPLRAIAIGADFSTLPPLSEVCWSNPPDECPSEAEAGTSHNVGSCGVLRGAR